MVTSPSKAKHIVLAEDDSADVMLVRLALKSSGLDCELRVLDDGDKVVNFIDEFDENPNAGPIDLVLLDMRLPKRDGEEILKRLRSSDRYAQTQVVVTACSDVPHDYAQAGKHVAMRYFPKPSDLAENMRFGLIVRDLLSQENTSAGLPEESHTEK